MVVACTVLLAVVVLVTVLLLLLDISIVTRSLLLLDKTASTLEVTTCELISIVVETDRELIELEKTTVVVGVASMEVTNWDDGVINIANDDIDDSSSPLPLPLPISILLWL